MLADGVVDHVWFRRTAAVGNRHPPTLPHHVTSTANHPPRPLTVNLMAFAPNSLATMITSSLAGHGGPQPPPCICRR